ncbi:hypothetical protein [Lentzea cavernae]|nr:hypothetical protein [Lentzea cavernae]
MGPEFVNVLMASGALLTGVGALSRPLFRYLAERRYVDRADPKDLPEIAKALHPQAGPRRNGRTRRLSGNA